MRLRYFDEYGDKLDEIEDDAQFPSGTPVTVEGYRGIAWRIDHVSPIEDRVVCIMVGDDRQFTFGRDELTPLAREQFCGECGQIGCTHDGLDRDE